MKTKHLFLFAFIMLIASCTKDTETTPATSADSDKFVGSWLCNEGSGTPFTIEISKVSSTEISIKNFYGLGTHGNAQCEVSGNSLTIPFQDVNDLTIVMNASGSGIYSKAGSSEKIKMNYIVDGDTLNNVVCTR